MFCKALGFETLCPPGCRLCEVSEGGVNRIMTPLSPSSLPGTKISLDFHWNTTYTRGMTTDDLKAWRKQHGYTQQRLADALGVIKVTVYRWECGDREIPSFLHLALEALEARGGELKKSREKKTDKGGKKHGHDLPEG